jgi:hypothetical protein
MPQLPANLKKPCPPIERLATEDWDDLAVAYMLLAAQYGECAARVNVLISQ